jgi:hypothetical protein
MLHVASCQQLLFTHLGFGEAIITAWWAQSPDNTRWSPGITTRTRCYQCQNFQALDYFRRLPKNKDFWSIILGIKVILMFFSGFVHHITYTKNGTYLKSSTHLLKQKLYDVLNEYCRIWNAIHVLFMNLKLPHIRARLKFSLLTVFHVGRVAQTV